jgi:multidrug efflux system membrane fusion protein
VRTAACLALVLTASLLASCGSGAKDSAKPAPAVPVRVAAVEQRDVPLEIPAFGTVEASSTVEIVPQVSGLVTQVHFKEGDFVKAGDLLFTIDTRPYAASMAVASAEVERYQALAEQARLQAERTEKLVAEGIATEQELDKARADAQSSAANVKLGRASLRSAGLNVSFARITSPLSGRTGALLVHAGNVVRAGEPSPLVVIRQLTPVQVKFAVPETYVDQIRERAKAATLDVRIQRRGDNEKPVTAPLTFLENGVDEATGTLTLKATYANAGLELWPGVSVEVALVLGVDRQAIVAPGAAVAEGQTGAYAFVVDQGRARLRKIEVARTTPEFAVLRSGLRAGEQVVTEGQLRLRDGAAVSIKPGPSAPGASASNGPEGTRP